jgi:Flp pilus assembly pilin Flp
MTAWARHLGRLWSDRRGQTAVEWVLLLAFFALPMVVVLGLLLAVLAEMYRMVTFLEGLPFP